MQYSQLVRIMDETGLSPEQISGPLGVSGMTYRRWLKCKPSSRIPQEYERNIAGGIYQLLAEGKLKHDSKAVSGFLESNMPEFFQAAISQFNVSPDLSTGTGNYQDKITMALSQIGNSGKVRETVDNQKSAISKFAKWGSDWKNRIALLTDVVRSKKLSLLDKLVAYGAFFYLVTPIDLIPDSIPVFGYIDDFGILGFAAAYYYKKYPNLFSDKNKSEI